MEQRTDLPTAPGSTSPGDSAPVTVLDVRIVGPERHLQFALARLEQAFTVVRVSDPLPARPAGHARVYAQVTL